MNQERDHHQSSGQSHYDDRVHVASKVEAEPVGLGQPAAGHSPQQSGQQDHRYQVQVDAEDLDPGAGQDGLGQGMPDGVAKDEDQVTQAEGQEPPENGGVAQPRQVHSAAAGVGAADPLQDFTLTQYDSSRTGQALPGAVKAGHRLTLQDQAEHSAVDSVSRE